MNGRQGWRAVGVEQSIGFDVPGGVEVREDLDHVYVYAEGRAEPVQVLALAEASAARVAAAVRAAAQVIAEAIFAPEAGR